MMKFSILGRFIYFNAKGKIHFWRTYSFSDEERIGKEIRFPKGIIPFGRRRHKKINLTHTSEFLFRTLADRTFPIFI